MGLNYSTMGEKKNKVKGEQMHLQFLLPKIIMVCISLPSGNKTWIHFSVVEIIWRIVMNDELFFPSPPAPQNIFLVLRVSEPKLP